MNSNSVGFLAEGVASVVRGFVILSVTIFVLVLVIVALAVGWYVDRRHMSQEAELIESP